DAGQGGKDLVVDKLAHLLRRDPARNVRVEHFKEVTETFALRLFAKFLEPLEGLAVRFELVDKCAGIQTEVRPGEFVGRPVTLDLAALNVVNGRAAEGLRRFARVTPVAHRPDVGRVVGPRGS